MESPKLFQGRGVDHPKMGMIKRRIEAKDILINCGENSNTPSPPLGEKWKAIIHDRTVSWLASWNDSVEKQVRYMRLDSTANLNRQNDLKKYEIARRLGKCVNEIREIYRKQWTSNDISKRQLATAIYLIDKLALRPGYDKNKYTVGCCTLRVKHLQLYLKFNKKENVVVLDFLGKDSIRYYNEVEVEPIVIENLENFVRSKSPCDLIFDLINTKTLNDYLKNHMDGLTAKVFRTYNASMTLQNKLDILTEPNDTLSEKILSYNRANRAVAILCNHYRSVPNSNARVVESLKLKIRNKRFALQQCKSKYNRIMAGMQKELGLKQNVDKVAEKTAKQLSRLKTQLGKFEMQLSGRQENRIVAENTSKLNYLDPRISVAWCKKHDVPIEKIFNKSQRAKFMWAIESTDQNYRF